MALKSCTLEDDTQTAQGEEVAQPTLHQNSAQAALR